MNANIKKRNKTPYKYSKTQKSTKSINCILDNFYNNNEYDNFQSTVSNITKQLNNISLGAISKTTTNKNVNHFLKEKNLNLIKNKSKDIFKIKNIKKNNDNIVINNDKENKYLTNYTNYDYSDNNNINVLNDVKNSNIIISKNNSFFISSNNVKPIKNNNYNLSLNHENELRQENNNLKENIKFLLGQVKKYQKCGIVMEEDKKQINNDDNNDIIEYKNKINEIINEKNLEIEKIKNKYENEIKFIVDKLSTLEIQYKNLKSKYNELKKKKDIIKKIHIVVIIELIYMILITMMKQ